jgi:RimJ/RimL family protein N-acetyltransferase
LKNPFIIGKNIYLRAPEEGDELIISLSENHPLPRETLFIALPSSTEQVREKILSLQRDPLSIAFTICRQNPDEAIGLTFFTRIDWVSRAAVYYIAISEEKNWSRGFGAETTSLMMNYAFDTLNFNRIQLHVFVENEKAVKAYQKCGFQIEGTLRQAMYAQGSYYDFYVMGLLRQDWSTPQE